MLTFITNEFNVVVFLFVFFKSFRNDCVYYTRNTVLRSSTFSSLSIFGERFFFLELVNKYIPLFLNCRIHFALHSVNEFHQNVLIYRYTDFIIQIYYSRYKLFVYNLLPFFIRNVVTVIIFEYIPNSLYFCF